MKGSEREPKSPFIKIPWERLKTDGSDAITSNCGDPSKTKPTY